MSTIIKELFFADLGSMCIVYKSREQYSNDPILYTYKSYLVVDSDIIKEKDRLKKIYPYLKLNNLCSGEAIKIIKL